MRIVLLFLLLALITSCEEDVAVKPEAKLRLEYPVPQYKPMELPCPYWFDKNEFAAISQKRNCGFNISYPRMSATLYLTYRPIEDDNLNSLLYDAQKLTYDHNSRADAIPEQVFVNPENDVYGMFYEINGNAATQAQFYVTDSVNHFLLGSLYFDAKPNFDSIYPAVVYLRNDMRKIMESLRWDVTYNTDLKIPN
ncbi:MAG: gliding motility-associated lipoprotein GldD [Candidatus Latescibacterota bacterium]|jgi:gliding motility-associated lipoprotein GldD